MSDREGDTTGAWNDTEPAHESLVPVRDQVAYDLDKAKVWASLFGTPGPRIGRFTVLGRIGAGGMGDVYAAYDDQLDRKIAIKLVQATRDVSLAGDQLLLREARTMARLSHPNVVHVYDAGTFQDRVFIAMEFIRGQTLRAWLEKCATTHAGRAYQRQVLDRFIAAGRGLEAAHDAGLVHRDFKPENVLIGDDGRPRVVDFGLARIMAPAAGNDPPGGRDSTGGRTAPARELVPAVQAGGAHVWSSRGRIMGTPPYMAPEQLRGDPVDSRADQYSFCVALYEALCRAEPSEAREAGQQQRISGARAADIPAALRKPLLRGLATQPEARFPSMGALLHALEAWPGRRRRRWLLGAASLVALAGGVALYTSGRDLPGPCATAGRDMARLWTAERKSNIEQAFSRTGLPYAQTTWQSVARTLDDYAASWQSLRVDTCAATHVHHVQSAELMDRGMICLDHGKQRFASLLDRLERADRQTVEAAGRAVAALPDLQPCGNAEILRDSVRPPDPDEAAAVDAIRARLADALTLELLGRYDEARDIASQELAASENLRYRPVHARALYQLGRFTVHTDAAADVARGEDMMLRAADLAEGERDLALKAEIWVALVRSAARHRAELERAREWSGRAQAAIHAVGDPPRFLGEALRHFGVAQRNADMHAQAEDMQRQGLRVLESGRDVPAVARAAHWQDLGNTVRAQKRNDDAQALYRQALDLYRAELGDQHPVVADLRFDMAMLDVARGQRAAARATLDDVLRIHRQTLGDDHPHVGRALLELADLDRQDGWLARAEERVAEALRNYETAYPPGHQKRAFVHTRLGAIAYRRGRYQEALHAYQAALAIETRNHGASSDAVAYTRLNIAEALILSGQYDDALDSLAVAEPILAPVMKDAAVEGFVAGVRGRALLGKGDIAGARAALELAVQRFQQADPGDVERADVYWALVRAWEAGGQGATERALTLAHEALAVYSAQVGETVTPKAELERWLARASAKKTGE